VTAPDVAVFLLARIAEDEVAALEAILKPRGNSETFSGQWLFMSDSDDLLQVGNSPILAKNVWPLAKAHIARHDPARVLAECAALRAIVEQYVRLNTRPYMPEGHGCGLHPGDCFDEDGGNISEAGFADYLYGPCVVWERVKRENPAAPPEATLRLLAQPFADHPDFNPAWRI
jgi:hypothetical protein